MTSFALIDGALTMKENRKCEVCGIPLSSRLFNNLCGDCLSAPLSDCEGGDASAMDYSPLPGSYPAEIGNYQVIERIAAGGMGIVYRALSRSLGREVAVKQLHAGAEWDPIAVARFQSEVASVAGLDHPNIIPVLDVGEQAGVPFFVMKLINGTPLSANPAFQYKDGRSDSGNAKERLHEKFQLIARTMAKVARAVHHAHQRGILHRDLKPSNILTDSEGEPYVADFGLAKRLDDNRGLTVTSAVLGTPSFMSPEQAIGDQSKISVATDIYSLGAILYFLLTGGAPFEGKSTLNVLKRVVEDEPVEPWLVRRPVDRDLSVIALKCLEKRTDRRFQSALELAEDLERWLRDEPILARRIGLFERGRKWCRRRPFIASASAMLTFFVLILGFQGWLNYQRISDEQAQTKEAKNRLEAAMAVARLEGADQFVGEGRDGEAIANLVANIRNEAGSTRNLGYLMSLMKTRLLPISMGPPLEHQDELWQLDFHPDGKRVAVACYDGTGRIWDIQSGTEMVPPLKHEDGVYRIDISPDGTRVVTGSYDGTARIWDVETGKPISEPLRHPGGVHVAHFDSTGNQVVTAGSDCTVRVWDRDGSALVFPELRHPDQHNIVHVAQHVPGRDLMITGSVIGLMRLWETPSGRLVKELDSGYHYLSELIFDAEGENFVVLGAKTSSLWSSLGWERVAPLSHQMTVWSASFRRSGDILVSMSADAMMFWDGRTGSLLSRVQGRSVFRSRVRSMPTRDAFVWFDHDTVYGLRYGDFKPAFSAIKAPFTIHGVDVDSERDRLAIRTRDHQVHFWELPEPRVQDVYRTAANETVSAAAFDRSVESGAGLILQTAQSDVLRFVSITSEGSESVDRSIGHSITDFISGESEGLLCMRLVPPAHGFVILEPDSGKTRLISGCGHYNHFRVSPDRKWVVIGVPFVHSDLRLYSMKESRFVGEALSMGHHVGNCRFSFDSQQIAVSTDRGSLTVIDVDSRNPVGEESGSWGLVSDFEYSPTEYLIAAGSEDGFLRIWKTDGEMELHWEVSLQSDVRSVSFSPNGSLLAAGLGGGDVSIWDVETGERIGLKMKHVGEILQVRFIPDGSRLLTISGDQTLRFWDAKSGSPLIEPLKWYGDWRSIDISGNGELYSFENSDDGITVRQVPMSISNLEIPKWFLPFAEAVGGIRLGTSGQMQLIPWRDRVASFSQIAELTQSDRLTQWAKHLVGEIHQPRDE